MLADIISVMLTTVTYSTVFSGSFFLLFFFFQPYLRNGSRSPVLRKLPEPVPSLPLDLSALEKIAQDKDKGTALFARVLLAYSDRLKGTTDNIALAEEMKNLCLALSLVDMLEDIDSSPLNESTAKTALHKASDGTAETETKGKKGKAKETVTTEDAAMATAQATGKD